MADDPTVEFLNEFVIPETMRRHFPNVPPDRWPKAVRADAALTENQHEPTALEADMMRLCAQRDA